MPLTLNALGQTLDDFIESLRVLGIVVNDGNSQKRLLIRSRRQAAPGTNPGRFPLPAGILR